MGCHGDHLLELQASFLLSEQRWRCSQKNIGTEEKAQVLALIHPRGTAWCMLTHLPLGRRRTEKTHSLGACFVPGMAC